MNAGKENPNWKNRVIEWQASGKSIRAWCFENHIPVSTFYGWKARLDKSYNDNNDIPLVKPKTRQVKQPFVELKDKKPSDSKLILEYEGVKIHLQANFNPSILKQCLDCLRGMRC